MWYRNGSFVTLGSLHVTVKAVVLAAGEGTRMRPLTDDKPKPLVEIDGKPMLERCFDSIVDGCAGTSTTVDSFVVVVGYESEEITERYGEEYDGRSVVYVHQEERKGLAHALLQAEPYIDDDFLLMHGDNVFAPSARENLRSVVRSDADATLLVEELPEEKARNTAVVVTRGDRVVDIDERDENPPSTLSVVGFYALPPAVFEACRRTEPSDRGERELGDALSLLADERDVRAVRLEGERVNVNRPEDVEKAERMLNL